MVVSQKLVKEVNSLVADETLVLSVNKRVPRLAREARENVIILRVQLNIVLVQVLKELFSSKNLGNLNQLVGVAVSVEEGLLAENHGCEHSTQRPHIQGIVVFLEVNQQLGTLEVPRCNTDIVFRALVVEFSQTPVNQAKLGSIRTTLHFYHPIH